MSWYLIIFFLAGVLQDFIATLNLRYIAKDKIFLAVSTSFFTTVIYMIILYNILTQLDSQRSIAAIISYALGIGGGTFFAMKFKLGMKEEKRF
ncbi:hypothetical protein A2V71_01195 [Candidatus Berkelbacteria bacterium RBG_13_40_8]|uniref:Uncharacterized protein n=1 Tax=Candidatus Berkelbacteria bacterium RBG_13_40_8 TaxID=1797467 RepID=A0A1F5DQ59_9BACT|nr:MAG: hypothetical protein A2V71_01195 [Candidatus Berkelbacteria bacterium RBG_13_40_8]